MTDDAGIIRFGLSWAHADVDVEKRSSDIRTNDLALNDWRICITTTFSEFVDVRLRARESHVGEGLERARRWLVFQAC